MSQAPVLPSWVRRTGFALLAVLFGSMGAVAQTIGLGTGNYSQEITWASWFIGFFYLFVAVACVVCLLLAAFEFKRGIGHGLHMFLGALCIVFACGIAVFIVNKAFPNQASQVNQIFSVS